MAKTTRSKEISRLNAAIAPALDHFNPPERLTVSEWADKKRRLSPETSAESGPWRTSRTPYLREPMDAFNDPRISRIVMVASSQVGKSELELNIIGYIIDQDPGSILYIQPTLDDAKKFSRLRVAPMIRDSHLKVADIKSKDSGNTILQKSFPGGMLTITGSNSASALASTPARYIIGDERDRWAVSAGTEGDPWALAEARQTTFYNKKAVEVSTPTTKGSSQIADSYELGTQEHWCHRCPDCGAYHCIDFDDIKIEKSIEIKNGKRKVRVTSVLWACPSCGCAHDEETMRAQPAKWIADNPEAYERGIRSFWLTAFASPWVSWTKIATKFLEAGKDPEKLKVVFNTLLGKLWEDRGEIPDDDAMLSRREAYGAELPKGVLILTCGVDTQDDRLEYEVVGYGKFGESWGIKKGVCLGRPDTDAPWERLDDVIDHVYKFADGHGLRISITMVDSGGHFTQEVYQRCRARQNRMVFAIKGKGGDGIPYTQPPRKTKIVIKGKSVGTCWLYTLGVDAGKTIIMDSLKVQEPGAKYCHFPSDEGRGYDAAYFNGLLSEKLVLGRSKTGTVWHWEKLPGHQRNEPLDCRDYATAGLRIIDPDMDALERKLRDLPDPIPEQQRQAPRRNRRATKDYDDW